MEESILDRIQKFIQCTWPILMPCFAVLDYIIYIYIYVIDFMMPNWASDLPIRLS